MWLNALRPAAATRSAAARPPARRRSRSSSSVTGVITSSGPQTRDRAISTLVPAVLRVLRKTKRCSWETITGPNRRLPSDEQRDERHIVVLVTGSMRSGTSSLAGSLKLLGWHVPQPEVPASSRNAKGHFEPRWAIEFHKRLLRDALIRPSDGSPRAEERIAGAARGRHRRGRAERLADRAGRAADRGQGPARRLGAATCGGGAAAQAGRDLRLLTALRHPAEVVGSQDITWGEGRRTDAERRVKETSNIAAWLNVALVTERGSRGAPRAFLRYDDLLDRLAHRPAAGVGPARPRPRRSTRTASWTSSSTPACGAPS